MERVSLHNRGTWEQCCKQWQDMEVDIAMACKHKIDMNQGSNLATMHQQASQILGQGAFRFKAASTPTTGHRFDIKSGGTMSMVIGNSKGRVLSTFTDEAGWWESVTLNQTQLPPLTLISTYQVVDVDPTNVGDFTYANQLAGFYSSQIGRICIALGNTTQQIYSPT